MEALLVLSLLIPDHRVYYFRYMHHEANTPNRTPSISCASTFFATLGIWKYDTASVVWQGMLKEIRTLISVPSSTSAANVAVIAPTRRASALFSQVAENEYRRHSIPSSDAMDNKRWEALAQN